MCLSEERGLGYQPLVFAMLGMRAASANAATSSLRMWTYSNVPSLRSAPVKPLSESPGKPRPA